MQDVVSCIRHNCSIDDAGFKRERHADRYLKPPEEMRRLFERYPEALNHTLEIAERCKFSLDELSYQYPEEKLIPGRTPQQALEKLTWEGAKKSYPEGLPPAVTTSLEHELRLIEKLQYAPYFLTVHSIVRFAESKGILHQGRGSAANSVVCYVLGITAINPSKIDLLFERFVSEERREPPDIDVDFEHERREEVMQWVFDTYGRDHAALCSTVIRYRTKGALRDVGKVLGLPKDIVTLLNAQVWGWSEDGIDPERAKELNLNVEDRRLKLAIELARQLIGTPRHLSQHPGGFVLTRDRLDELVPIEPAAMKDRQVIEWDKDDIDVLKFMKVDCLALGMLSCMKRGFDLLQLHKGEAFDLSSIPEEDPKTYEMICKADTLGTFQIESRAQMTMLPRLQPRTYYDLVIEVAIVRPGPIQGNMVHPYLRRREGKEAVVYPKPELKKVLGKTMGVPLFQEQAMRVAIECAGFTPSEADQLRRSMATFKFTGGVHHFRTKLVNGMLANGYDPAFAENMVKQLEGFGSYGFPESHAASFALIAYASSWLKCHHPDVFCAALLNAQPMGFYAPAQIVRDAAEHGVEIRPICVNASRWDTTLEATADNRFAVRLGLRMVKGLANAHAAKLIAARGEQKFTSVDDAWRRANVPASALVQIAEADGFQPSLQQSRRAALWALKGLADEPLALFAAATAREKAVAFLPEQAEPQIALRPMTAAREVVEDYVHIGLSLRAHPLSFLRDAYVKRKYSTCAQAMQAPDNQWLETAGIVLVRQRPGSAKGVMFITIEDETGIANLVVWPSLYEMQRRIVHTAGMIAVYGRIQCEGEVVHLIAHRLTDLSPELVGIGERNTTFPLSRGRGDEAKTGGGPDSRETLGRRPRDIYIPDLHIDRIKVRPRNFR
jgi:error-prone DNA polymerase